ncbi:MULTISPECIES: 2-C-methyl-D-erythritol 4-phosphate cytidylyltransferase [unclassified Achromobacter]|uniref:2-C-methyl-D-erythritol 4-phosphate cytidylyltransferase n=1 Tax=unclassified Achromobacter TaxID=2626865 RepID=UPI000B519EB7|nr:MULTISPECIES: 2-C-methyl-D-erythritol 4-phosphate cytidylyltransferase [unclassified Achromobacter]OWT68269.1 2-C-methyl-D-erythritol 4-phosphate cytidylyltransferase [Achromobacter sp. HZ34]OWT70106.1 2-C-methyl-D-erythritol 4-phosphate cytidylyltransferase [Achromobacter sp. HZ28]
MGVPTPAGAAPLPKQYRLLRGQPMLRLAVAALLADPRIREVRVAVAPDDPWAAQALAGLPRTVLRYCGASTRAGTVANALADSGAGADDWVLVHDAARPGLPADALARLIDACLGDEVGGLLALPVADTVKGARTPGSGSGSDSGSGSGSGPGSASRPAAAPTSNPDPACRVARTVDRDGLWLAQTPQMFRAGMLAAALHAAARDGVPVTDEASALEAAGHAPLLVPGALRNFKVTWPDDFDLMEKWL